MKKRGLTSEEWLRLQPNAVAVRDFIQPKTAPLLLFESTVIRPNLVRERGSGVLVKLGKHFFILTAGHCVSSCKDAKAVVIPIVGSGWSVEDAIRLSPTITRGNLESKGVTTSKGTVDFGYIELDAETASTMAARFYVFTSRLTVRRPPENSLKDEWVIIAGYPEDEAQRTEHSDQARFSVTVTLVATKEELPEDLRRVPGAPEGFETLDLLVPRNSFYTPDGEVFIPCEPGSYQGVSGGGCWTMDLSRDAADWTSDDKPSLCAIHTGTEMGETFLREVPIGYHLRLIVENYPDLVSELNDRWPELRDFSLR